VLYYTGTTIVHINLGALDFEDVGLSQLSQNKTDFDESVQNKDAIHHA
jgi:hypothetical protein